MSQFTPKQNKEFWNDFAEKSKNNVCGASGNSQLVEIENQFITSELESRKTESLLDIGCGNGQRTLLFSKYISKKTIGIDYSEKMIHEAKILLNQQSESIKKKLFFEHNDVHHFPNDEKFDVIISCRCIINQPNHETQLKLFERIHNSLNPGGSLILAEISKEGMDRLDILRNKFGLSPMQRRWHNLQIEEKKIFPQIERLFNTKKINRAGLFYFISRVIYPASVYPAEPDSESKINEMALKSELLLQNEQFLGNNEPFEKIGGHLLIHFIKK